MAVRRWIGRSMLATAALALAGAVAYDVGLTGSVIVVLGAGCGTVWILVGIHLASD